VAFSTIGATGRVAAAAATRFGLAVPVEHLTGRRDEHGLNARISALGCHQIRCARLGEVHLTVKEAKKREERRIT